MFYLDIEPRASHLPGKCCPIVYTQHTQCLQKSAPNNLVGVKIGYKFFSGDIYVPSIHIRYFTFLPNLFSSLKPLAILVWQKECWSITQKAEESLSPKPSNVFCDLQEIVSVECAHWQCFMWNSAAFPEYSHLPRSMEALLSYAAWDHVGTLYRAERSSVWVKEQETSRIKAQSLRLETGRIQHLSVTIVTRSWNHYYSNDSYTV